MIEEFLAASAKLGESPLRVQGAGGNTSMKRGSKMYVKASGHHLDSLKKNFGYVCCQFPEIQTHLKNLPKSILGRLEDRENKFNRLISRHVVKDQSFGEPSIETGMHAILGRYVLHTHDVYANVLNCMVGGRELIERILNRYNPAFIEYRNPGLQLAHALTKLKEKSGSLPAVIFLQNHGLIVHHPVLSRAISLNWEINQAIEKFIRSQKAFRPFRVIEKKADFSRHLFPDSVVYSQVGIKDLSKDKKQTLYEISSASNYILNTIRLIGGQPVFIDPIHVSFIKNMEKEKMRVKMAEGR